MRKLEALSFEVVHDEEKKRSEAKPKPEAAEAKRSSRTATYGVRKVLVVSLFLVPKSIPLFEVLSKQTFYWPTPTGDNEIRHQSSLSDWSGSRTCTS